MGREVRESVSRVPVWIMLPPAESGQTRCWSAGLSFSKAGINGFIKMSCTVQSLALKPAAIVGVLLRLQPSPGTHTARLSWGRTKW